MSAHTTVKMLSGQGPEDRAPDLPMLVSPARAARELALSRRAVYDLIAAGEIVGVVRIGRRLAIRREALLEFLDGLPDVFGAKK